MLKKTDNLYDLLNIKDQKKIFDQDINNIINIINKVSGIVIKNKDVFIKNNILKIKTSSNNKFIMLLNINKINSEIKSVFKNRFNLEL